VLKVLIIGPENLSGVLGSTVLGRPDIDRQHVDDPARAVESAERARPHMVVIDVPRAEATSLVRQLREHEVTRPTAIVWLNRTEPPEAETELAVAGQTGIPVPWTPSCGTAVWRSC
jgi:DNA-binding response OmpR family regulator